MKRAVAGIDPGKKGAWVIMDEDGEIISFGDYANRDKADVASVDLGMIEKVSSRPGQGVVSVFTFGVSYGIWQGHLEAYGTPFEFVLPNKWQKAVLDYIPAKHLKPDGETSKGATARRALNRAILKEAIVEFVKRKYPDLKEVLSLKKNWDIADAVCIALYGVLRLKKLV